MNWIKSNKGFALFFAVSILLAAALAFLVFQAYEKDEESLKNYTALLGQLNGLQRQSPFPDQVSLKALQIQKREHKESIEELQRRLNAMELPLDPITEVQFQDALRDTVQRVSSKAAASGMKLPDKFYMGFDQYQGEPPRREAAPALGRELKAIEFIIAELAESGVASLTKLNRTPIPEEISKQKPGEEAKELKSNTLGKPGRQLAAKAPIEVSFVSTQRAFRNAFNNIVSSQRQFFIPRLVEVRNEKDKGPLKSDPSSGPVSTPGVSSSVTDPNLSIQAGTGSEVRVPSDPSQSELRYLVGDEKIEVTLWLELIDFWEGPVK